MSPANTVVGKNPAPVDIPFFTGFHKCQVAIGGFLPTINSISLERWTYLEVPLEVRING